MSHAAPNSGGGGAGVSTHSASRLQRSMLQIALSSAARTPAMQATTDQEADGPMADTAATYASQASSSMMPTPDTLSAPGGVSALAQRQQQQQQQSIPMLDMGVGASFADGDLSTFNDIIFGLHGNMGGMMAMPWPDLSLPLFKRYLSLFVVTIKKAPYYPKADQSDPAQPPPSAQSKPQHVRRG
ncbi:hypothetical protein LTS18_011041 [Coniosporium uncinatum]|uniref:Uncharacterized protein n=1 Tax=Coniosporium uncinatum TaxID=93489 RepID=A0ACC3CZA9_9PEZI|nr:hypothetical protein LTS18_011041 [Coniosporium uncinatum]